jgi:hypothetical protein
VIHEIDEALRSLIAAEAVPDLVPDVEFEAPTRDWVARRNAPAVNAFLYDVREDTERRHVGPAPVRDPQGVVVRRQQPPRWFRLSYLVTAWTSRAQDEHRLLSALLGSFLRYDALPVDHLTAELVGLGIPVPMTIALPPPESRSVADVWSALGGELKPSLDLVVTAPFFATPAAPVGPPVTEDFTLEVRDETNELTDVAIRRFRARE